MSWEEAGNALSRRTNRLELSSIPSSGRRRGLYDCITPIAEGGLAFIRGSSTAC